MRRLLATTAITLLTAVPLHAEGQQAAGEQNMAPVAVNGSGALFVPAQMKSDIFSSDLVGMNVYSSATDYGADYGNNQIVPNDVRSGWDEIGDIGDLLISDDGKVKAVLVDVGGFLGMGEHTVALSMDDIHLLTDETGARFAAVTSSREALEATPEFERLPEPAATAPADTMGAAPAPAGTMAAAPAGDVGSFVPLGAAEVTSENLDGAAVYGTGDKRIGDVAKLVVGADGKITQVVVDAGGFLGIGTHRVALTLDQLRIMTNPETNEVRVYTDATKEEIKQMPEYKG